MTNKDIILEEAAKFPSKLGLGGRATYVFFEDELIAFGNALLERGKNELHSGEQKPSNDIR